MRWRTCGPPALAATEVGTERVAYPQLPMTSRVTCALLLAALAAALPIGNASADRKPNDREKSKLVAVFDRAGFSCDVFPEARCHRRLRVSTVNERWAAAYIRGDEDEVQFAEASAKRKNHRWRVVQIGNGGGCDAPKPVRRDLGLGCGAPRPGTGIPAQLQKNATGPLRHRPRSISLRRAPVAGAVSGSGGSKRPEVTAFRACAGGKGCRAPGGVRETPRGADDIGGFQRAS